MISHPKAKIIAVAFAVLLCVGMGLFSFLKLSAVERADEFNLYSLVPSTAMAVFETDNISQFIQDINQLSCSKQESFRPIFKLLTALKLYLPVWLENTPHGLSKQVNNVILSFHQPHNDHSQVLYCKLGDGDYALMETFINQCATTTFSPKLFDYKGEVIHIYPMEDDSFLACYFTSSFLVASYQKRLIEEVIDAHLSGRSLLSDASFGNAHTTQKSDVSATLYANLGGWVAFKMTMNGDAIYFSGMSYDTDSIQLFTNMASSQQPVEGFPGDILPASTYSFNKRSITDWQATFRDAVQQVYNTAAYPDYIKARDEDFLFYLQENGGKDMVTCLFQRTDTTTAPGMVMSVAVIDALQAERLLKNLLDTTPPQEGAPRMPRPTLIYAASQARALYVMPRNTLFEHLANITKVPLYTYGCFYRGRLLLSPDAEGLSLYMASLEKGETMLDRVAYQEGISGLSSSFGFMSMTNLAGIAMQPDRYVRLLPSFFLRNKEFFRHFTLSTQLIGADGVVYPQVAFMYQGEPVQ